MRRSPQKHWSPWDGKPKPRKPDSKSGKSDKDDKPEVAIDNGTGRADDNNKGTDSSTGKGEWLVAGGLDLLQLGLLATGTGSTGLGALWLARRLLRKRKRRYEPKISEPNIYPEDVERTHTRFVVRPKADFEAESLKEAIRRMAEMEPKKYGPIMNQVTDVAQQILHGKMVGQNVPNEPKPGWKED